uniref:Microtubule-associated protein RP/EB family member 1 n=1 Tax=Aceria tosichella TaxID=561515 RepID=A0A6G1SAF9_9ACAR
MTELAGQQDKCVNIPATSATSENISQDEMLNWVNDCLQADYKKIEELSNGSAYAQLMNLLFPGSVPIKEIKSGTYSEHEHIQNFNLVQAALKKIGCNQEIPVDRLVKAQFQDNLEFLQWFKNFFDANYDGHNKYNAPEARDNLHNKQSVDITDDSTNIKTICKSDNDGPEGSNNRQLVLFNASHSTYRQEQDNQLGDVDADELYYRYNSSLLDLAWSRRIHVLVGNKAKLMESFSWLSTVGGGFSSLGERDCRFSARAGALSLGQQLRLAELLGDERLKVMCHLFAALAALQLDNKFITLNYIKRVILPLIDALPYRDPILTNILKHICFRISVFDRLIGARKNAIEGTKKNVEQQNFR